MPKKLVPDENNPTVVDAKLSRSLLAHNVPVPGGFREEARCIFALLDAAGVLVAEREISLQSALSVAERNDAQVRAQATQLLQDALRDARRDFAGVNP